MKIKKKDSRLWHIAKKWCPKSLAVRPPTILKPIKLSDDGMEVTISNQDGVERTFNMKSLAKFLDIPNGGRFEFQNLPHKGE